MPADVVWSAFVRVEGDVSVGERTVAGEEEEIATLVNQIQTGPGTVEHSGAVQRWDLVMLISIQLRHEQDMKRYQASLQAEHQFFVLVAQDPTLRTALTGAAAWTPGATSVVAYNLGAVTAQQRQEQSIAAPESVASAQVQQQLRVFIGAPKLIAPVGGMVSQGFGPTNLAMEPSIDYGGVFYKHFHTGIDITNVLDTPVGAAAAGRVIIAGSEHDTGGGLVGYGNYVVIDHGDGYITLYGHLDQVLVVSGQSVRPGQEIGLLGSTGWSTGPHLHFEIRHNGDFIDPETVLGAAVRP